jgi:hypothetical protein
LANKLPDHHNLQRQETQALNEKCNNQTHGKPPYRITCGTPLFRGAIQHATYTPYPPSASSFHQPANSISPATHQHILLAR